MKKFLLLGAAALMVVSASAQLKRSATTTINKAPKVERLNLNYVKKEGKVANGAIAPALRAPKKAGYIEPFYYRPAGAYYSPMIAVKGAGVHAQDQIPAVAGFGGKDHAGAAVQVPGRSPCIP